MVTYLVYMPVSLIRLWDPCVSDIGKGSITTGGRAYYVSDTEQLEVCGGQETCQADMAHIW